MTHEHILDRLKTLLNERFSIDPSTVDGSTRRAEMGIDSILMVDLMLDIETELGIAFESMELPPNPSLDDVTQLISRNLTRAS